MPPIIACEAVTKRYANGFLALDAVDLAITRGEIFALLGPNGAGKTTLIGVVCGTVSMTSGSVSVAGFDIQRDFRAARSRIGLVPQEIALDIFATVWATVSLQPPPVRPAARSGLCRAPAERPVAVGKARFAHRRALGRHEAARDDRQGPQPRARGAVPRRADRRRRRQPQAGHVGAGAPAARRGRHRDPDDALHRGGRGNGRPRRRHRRRPPAAGRGQGGADAQARQAAPDARPAASPARPARLARRLADRARGRRPAARLQLRRVRRGHRRADAAAGASPTPASTSPTSKRRRAASRTFSSTSSGARHEGAQSRRRMGDLPLRTVAHRPDLLAERGDAGHHHRALFRRLRRRDRLAHPRGRRRGLRRLHRAGPDHAVAAHPKHLQRLDRDLLPQVHRHDLRDPVGPPVGARGGDGLCRGGGDQVRLHRPCHPGDLDAVRAACGSIIRCGWSPS